jgi:hypothetical protein
MNTSTQIAKHLREVFFGGNWTYSNVKDNLAGLTYIQANTQVHNLNTIAMLTFHIGYYVTAIIKVLEGGPLEAHDKYSFKLPPIQSQQEWDRLVDNLFAEVETLAKLVEQLPEEKWEEPFDTGKYGTYYRNLHGLIEHTHYHLGQIALVRKMVMELPS